MNTGLQLPKLKAAYHRGMVVARSEEERELLNEIEALVGPQSTQA